MVRRVLTETFHNIPESLMTHEPLADHYSVYVTVTLPCRHVCDANIVAADLDQGRDVR